MTKRTTEGGSNEHLLLAKLTEAKNIARVQELKLHTEVFEEALHRYAYDWIVASPCHGRRRRSSSSSARECRVLSLRAEIQTTATEVRADAGACQTRRRPFSRAARPSAGSTSRGEANPRAQGALPVIAIGKYQNSSSPLLMATRRPRHSLGASGKTETAPRLNRIVHQTVELTATPPN